MTMRSRKLAGPTLIFAFLFLGHWPEIPADDQAKSQEESPPARDEVRQQDRDREKQPGALKPPAAAPKGAPARKTAAAAPPLRFTDLDLERYHQPAPLPSGETPGEEEVTAPPAAAGPAAATAGTKPSATPAAGKGAARPVTRPVVLPPNRAPRPADDPLQPFRDREAKEKFRQMQIETARERIATLQGRLDYLNTKRDALSNPAPLLSGQTQTQNPPLKPGEPPPPPTPIQGPGRGLTATPGPGKTPVVGFFPPIPPPQTDEDKENDKKLKVKDLLKQVDDEIKTVQEELETARDELAAVETRFAQESQTR